jgi:hypothetical protein
MLCHFIKGEGAEKWEPKVKEAIRCNLLIFVVKSNKKNIMSYLISLSFDLPQPLQKRGAMH